MGARWVRNSRKVNFVTVAIITLGGSPTMVAIPPMFDSMASAIRKGTAFI